MPALGRILVLARMGVAGASCSGVHGAVQEEAADAKVKGLAKKVKNAEAALQRARDDLAKLVELCAPQLTWPCCRFLSKLSLLVLQLLCMVRRSWHRCAGASLG